jgi:hypothetical protein
MRAPFLPAYSTASSEAARPGFNLPVEGIAVLLGAIR